VPIFGRKPWPAFKEFHAHVQRLVGVLLPTQQHVSLIGAVGDDYTAYLGFAPSPGSSRPTVALDTTHGRVQFYFRQELHVEHEKGNGFRLTTKRYWYHLYKGDAIDAFMRWEYVDRKLEPEARYPRHHLHIHDVVLPIDGSSAGIDLKKTHLPTGWVTIEEVLRFLISELGVTSPCGGRWDQELRDGERRFYEEFTSKRYK
jgi:hypothetical protein